MPIHKITSTRRGKAAIAAVLAGISAGSYAAYNAYAPNGQMDPAVVLAAEKLIMPWEGLRTNAYLDSVGIPTICWGETKNVRLGMTKTPAECRDMLISRTFSDYQQPIVKCAPKLAQAPVSVRAAMISGSYNFGVGAWCRSTAKRMIDASEWNAACEAQTAFNKAGGRVLTGLVNRREMGDAQRIGEAELCVSGL